MSDFYQEPEPGSVPQRRPWYSGWCGPGPCRDTDHRCNYRTENGSLAPTRYIYCSCRHHDDHRVEGDPLFGGGKFPRR